MLYIIIEQGNDMPIKNQLFKTFDEANIERIYLQPEYDNLLKVMVLNNFYFLTLKIGRCIMDKIKYKQSENGTHYHLETNDILIDVLERVRINKIRVRIWLGEKGMSWNEEHNTIGYIGRSTGNIKIPLLVHNSRSLGGGGLLDHCIVKIVNISNKKVLWKHKNFSQGYFWHKDNKVYKNDQEYAPNCKNEQQAIRLCAFMNGKRNCK